MTMKYELLAIDSLLIDRTNPRIAMWCDCYEEDDIPEEQLAMALGVGGESESDSLTSSGGSYRSLKESIKTNGGVIHPIVVNKQLDGTLLVIEGNTRTAIYRELQKEQKDETRWRMIPAIVHDGLEQKDVDSIRLQAHLVGPRDWDPYSKAKYLSKLFNEDHLTAEQIVAFCGGKKRQVEDYIAAYSDMEQHYRPISGDQGFEHKSFSAFVELQKPRIQQSLIRHQFTKDDFAKWVYDRKFRPLQTVRELPKILQSEKSREAFLAHDAEEARIALISPDTASALKDISFLDLAHEFFRRVDSFEWKTLQQMKKEDISEERDILDQTKELLDGVLQVILD